MPLAANSLNAETWAHTKLAPVGREDCACLITPEVVIVGFWQVGELLTGGWLREGRGGVRVVDSKRRDMLSGSKSNHYLPDEEVIRQAVVVLSVRF